MSEKTLERLEELLDAKDAEVDELAEANRKLERELEGSLSGWANHQLLKDEDATLPLPRLEMVYVPVDEWRSYKVVYRLVYEHLVDGTIGVPLGETKISGGVGNEPEPDHLPFRDGAHAHHDSAHFGFPLYRRYPGKTAERILDADYGPQRTRGLGHRRH